MNLKYQILYDRAEILLTERKTNEASMLFKTIIGSCFN